jgi:chaperonin GroES
MLNLEKKLVLTKAVAEAPNLMDRFSEDDHARIAGFCVDGYRRDRFSRSSWERRSQAALNLAMQLVEEKSFPWPNASNVAFPLVTIAALQFHARAYPNIVQGTEVVRTRIIGADPDGTYTDRAARIQRHMSWQMLEEDAGWEEGTDRMLIVVPILGCAFKKSYYSGERRRNTSELVLPHDLVVSYRARSVEDAPRKSQIMLLSRNTVYERAMREVFADVRDAAWFQADPIHEDTQTNADRRQGTSPPATDESSDFQFIEQHCLLDLDCDGYAEPYIATVELGSGKLCRLVARWEREEDIERMRGGVVKIRATEYYTKIPFIPSPDGGIYDIGFGTLIGPLNESVSTIVNQLIDAGTLATTGGGFLGKGARIRGGQMTFGPFQWNRVDATGDDLRKNIVPLEVKEPSQVLFQLLGMLIEYTQRIGGATDTQAGENPGQNTKVGTFQGMVEQGEKVYSSIFKRIWRAMKGEFEKCRQLNAVYLPDMMRFGPGDAYIMREDYLSASIGIVPVADPNIVSDQSRLQRALVLGERKNAAMGYDSDAVERRILAALRIENPEEVFKGSEGMTPPVDPKVQVEQIRDAREKEFAKQEAQLDLMRLLDERAVSQANVAKLYADAAYAMESAGGVKTGHQIAAFQAQIAAEQAKDDALVQRITQLRESLENELQRGHEKEIAQISASAKGSGE